jgi:hypothetical protein
VNVPQRDLDRVPTWVVLLLALALLVAGTMIPLADPDLPEHLAMGEWIVRHRAVPFTEPFAWTRWGAPYYAYSWLAESLYYVLFKAGGLFALRVLHGIALAASLLSVWFLGRCARWTDWARLAAAAGTIWVYLIVASYLRPQEFLFTLVPLAWAFGYRILDPERDWRPSAAGLVVVNAVAANVHLFFVLCALPVWLILALPVPRLQRRRVGALVVAPIVGWLLTPYVLVWPAVFRLYFAPNPLMRWPSVIVELRPGAQAMLSSPAIIPAILLLAVLPWTLNVLRPGMSRRETWVFGALWTAGAFTFAWALRLVVVWWFAALPLTGFVLAVIPIARTQGLRGGRIITACFIVLAPAVRLRIQRQSEPPRRGITTRKAETARGLQVDVASVLDPLVVQLQREPASCGNRIMTAFDLGSYLTWQLPGYSVSEDSRGIFPDSVLLPEAFHTTDDGPELYGAWRTADLVIIPLRYRLAPVLDTTPGWRHAATALGAPQRTPPDTTHPSGVGLWVRQSRDSCVGARQSQPSE